MATFTGSFWSKALSLEGTRSAEGLDPVPGIQALGGVVADGEILRTATLNLIALRQNCKVASGRPAGSGAKYILGLGAVALTMQPETFLRQGCLLVPDGDGTTTVVLRNGKELTFSLGHQEALDFALAASQEFGISDLSPITAVFQIEKVEKPKAGKDKPAKGK